MASGRFSICQCLGAVNQKLGVGDIKKILAIVALVIVVLVVVFSLVGLLAEETPGEQGTLPTETAIPTAIPTATASSEATDCPMENVPEPPDRHLDCETWETAYTLMALDLGYSPPEAQWTRIATEIYPLIVAGARACNITPTELGDYIYVGAQQMEREGKPSAAPDQAIAYLIGVVGTDEFREFVESAGGCGEAIVLVGSMTE